MVVVRFFFTDPSALKKKVTTTVVLISPRVDVKNSRAMKRFSASNGTIHSTRTAGKLLTEKLHAGTGYHVIDNQHCKASAARVLCGWRFAVYKSGNMLKMKRGVFSE